MWFWPRNRKKTAPPVPNHNGPAARQTTKDGPGRLSREVATVASDLHEPLAGWLGVQPNRDPVLGSRQPDAAYAWPFGLYEEAIDKDAHLAAILAQRKAAVLSWEQQLSPADDSAEAQNVQRFVEDALKRIGTVAKGDAQSQLAGGGLLRDLSELLDAIPYGFAVSEIIWEQEDRHDLPGTGALLPRSLLSRHPRRFVFGTGGDLRLLTESEPVSGAELPCNKFLVFAPYGRHENPYGTPVLRNIWWLAYFKRQVLKYWVMFCEKFGSPTTVLTHPLGATEREKRTYRRVIGSIQQETGLVVPQGVELDLLEPERPGSVTTYKYLIEFCNAEMSKAVLGQTLTTDEGGRGSYALGRVHLTVREDIVRQDAAALAALINGQLIRWIVDLNFPASQRKYPVWKLTPPREQDLELQLKIDSFFSGQGLPLDETELYARYGRQGQESV